MAVEGQASPADRAVVETSTLEGSPSRVAAAGGWDWDVLDRTLVIDARFAQLHGLDASLADVALPTSRFFENVHAEDVRRLRIGVAGALHGAEVFSREYRVLAGPEGVRWLAARGGIDRDDTGRVVRFTGVLTDVTDRKKVEERLAIAQTAGQVGTFEYVVGFGTVSVSHQFCRLLGLRPADALPVRTINALVAPDRPAIFGSISLDEALGEHLISRASDREPRWIAVRGERRRDDLARDDRFIGVIYDITESKRNEERLVALTDRLEESVRERTFERDRVWNNSRDLLAVLGPDLKIRSASPSWRDLGLHPARLVGRPFLALVSPEDRSLAAAALSDAGVGEPQVRHVSASGAVRWIRWRSVVEDEAVYVYGRDVTDEKMSAEALRATEDQLRQAHKMEAVGQLTGGLAHDFNNMLTGVIGGLDLIKRRLGEGRLTGLDRYIDAAVSSAQRAAALTHRLLAFSRQQTLDPKAVNVNALVGSMEDMLRRTLGEQVDLKFAPGAHLWSARTDENQLESAILNLSINARDAMPAGGLLTIETANVRLDRSYTDRREELTPGSYVLLSVTDTGEGMTKETIQKAFDPFFTTKPIGQGTGLGLSMIYGFMRQIGGHIEIYSEQGQGTTVKLYVPKADGDAGNVEAQARHEPHRGAGETVLVVEDDQSVRLLIVDVLKELGYTPIEASDAASAAPIIGSDTAISLLISDVGLPGMSGRELANVAREKRPNLPVLFITGYAANAAIRAEFLGDCMDLISKPFQLDDLAGKIQAMILS